MAGEDVAKQSSERRRSRAGLNLNVNFNGGVVLLLGAGAGALLASAFAAHRTRAHRRRRGLRKEGIQGDSVEHLAAVEAKEFVEFVGDEEGERDGANAGEGLFQVNSHDNLDASVQIAQVDQREIDFCLLDKGKGEIEERSSTIDIELVDGERGEIAGLIESSADTSSSPASTFHNLGEKQLRYDEEASVKEECKASFVNSEEEDGEDNEKAYIDEWDEKEEIDENMNSKDLHSERRRLLEKKISQNSEMVIATEERNLEDGFKDEMCNSRAKEPEASPSGDHNEINPLIEERDPFFEEIGEAKKALDIAQNDSGKHPEMVIMEDGVRRESGDFKDDERRDILHAQQDNEERDASDGKMEGSRDLCEQTVALSHESSSTAITEPETSSCNDFVMVKAKEDFQLIAHINGIKHIEEEKMGVEDSNCPNADEGVDGLMDEIQGKTQPPLGSSLKKEASPTECCSHKNPAMIISVEEKTQLEENSTSNLNDVIQEKTDENLLTSFKENVESSEAEENLRENEECPLTESLSLDHDNLMMACKENPLIQFQRIEPIVREEKACLDDRLSLSIESNMKIVHPIQDNNFDNTDKTLEIEESHMEASAADSVTSPDEELEEREDNAVALQYHEHETMQHIEDHKDIVETEIQYPQTLPVGKKEEAEIHKESGAQIKEEEHEKEQILKLSFDLVEKRGKIVAQTVKQDTNSELFDVDENTVSSKGKQQRIARKKVKRTEYVIMGYHKGYIFLLTILAIAFAVLAFLYAKDFITRRAILEDFITS